MLSSRSFFDIHFLLRWLEWDKKFWLSFFPLPSRFPPTSEAQVFLLTIILQSQTPLPDAQTYKYYMSVCVCVCVSLFSLSLAAFGYLCIFFPLRSLFTLCLIVSALEKSPRSSPSLALDPIPLKRHPVFHWYKYVAFTPKGRKERYDVSLHW